MSTHKIVAKPLVWKEYTDSWTSDRGFHIQREDDPDGKPFAVSWGEDDPETFATLDEAKQWCEAELTNWLQDCGMIVEAA